jgi:hypothetical protein
VPAVARIELSQQKLQTALTGPAGMVTQYVIRTTRQIENRAKLYAPVDTGNLRASITSAIDVQGLRVVGQVGSPVEYALAVHDGQQAGTVTVRGHQRRGHSVRGSAGRKAYRVGNATVGTYTRRTKGTRGRPFLRRAMEDVVR